MSEHDAFGVPIEPAKEEKQLADAPPADAVERLKGQLREAQENDRTGAAER